MTTTVALAALVMTAAVLPMGSVMQEGATDRKANNKFILRSLGPAQGQLLGQSPRMESTSPS